MLIFYVYFINLFNIYIDFHDFLAYINYRILIKVIIMTQDWQELTRLTRGRPFIIERIRFRDQDIHLEGEFEPPPLAGLTMEDQIFITAFIRSHGSIKEMEELFGISYPTVKNRLNRISSSLEFVEVDPPASHLEILERLNKGELSVKEALKTMQEE